MIVLISFISIIKKGNLLTNSHSRIFLIEMGKYGAKLSGEATCDFYRRSWLPE